MAQHQLTWMAQWHKVNAFEALVSRRAQQERLLAGRVEQRQTDEMASQMHQRLDRFLTSIDNRF
ncbi:flagellar FliJ family protein [Pseudomonas sp. NA13]